MFLIHRFCIVVDKLNYRVTFGQFSNWSPWKAEETSAFLRAWTENKINFLLRELISRRLSNALIIYYNLAVIHNPQLPQVIRQTSRQLRGPWFPRALKICIAPNERCVASFLIEVVLFQRIFFPRVAGLKCGQVKRLQPRFRTTRL